MSSSTTSAASLALLGLSSGLLLLSTPSTVYAQGPLPVFEQQQVADTTDLDVANQTIDSQAPYYGWEAPHSFQPWDVQEGAGGYSVNASVYGSQYIFQVSNQSSQGNPLVYIAPGDGSGTFLNTTAKQTSNTGTFQKIVVIFMENMEWAWTESDPNWQTVSELGMTFTNYSGISHPSEPNYAAIWGGDFFGINSDGYYSVNATNLADLADLGGRSWKAYQENYVANADGSCNNAFGLGYKDVHGSQLYVRKHDPPMLYTNINSNNTRCSRIVNQGQFALDVLNNQLPDISFYTPNSVNDGHDVDDYNDPRTTSSGWWVKLFLNTYLWYLQQQNVLLLLTFDEADYPNTLVPYPELYPVANQIPAIAYGPASLITPNTTYGGYVNHYGVLDAIEQNFALGSLGRNDTVASNGGQNFFDALHNISVIHGESFASLAGDSVVPSNGSIMVAYNSSEQYDPFYGTP